MKRKYIAMKISLASLCFFLVITACKKSADFSIDPISRDTLFNFTPTHGYPGNTVLIQGSGLNDVLQVSFGVKNAEIVSKSNDQISVKVPVGALTGKINLVKATDVVISLKDFTVDATPVPTILGFTPEIAGSGDTVTISGNQLDQVDSVFIGTLKATVLEGVTESSMKIKIPLGLKTDYINMYYDYMTSYGIKKTAFSKSDKQLSLDLPRITSFDADISKLNVGQQLVIKGTMFGSVSQVRFVNRFAGAADTVKTATYTASGDTMLTVAVPAGAVTGVIKLTVTDGTIESTRFTVNLPVITSFNPAKGASQATSRAFTVTGTNLDLVTSATIGSTQATIQTQTATQLILIADGNASGSISLIAPNGTVKSSLPFIQTGDFWLADYDRMFTPVRLFNDPMYTGAANSESWADATVTSKTIVASGQERGNYRSFTVKFAGTNSPRMYLRGDQGASANPAPDRFLLYTGSSQGVTFQFDISFDAIPTAMVNAQGNVDLKLLFFNADQTAGGGYGYYTDHIMVKYDGPGVWKTVTVNTNLTRVANDSYMYNTTVPAVSSKKFAPNNCRIIAVMFQGAYGTADNVNTGVKDQSMTVNFDNIKFTIN